MGRYGQILKKFKEKLSRYGSKKIIEKALIIAIISVICLIAGSVMLEGNTNKNKNPEPSPVSNAADTETGGIMKQGGGENKSEIETDLESILSKIKGAGKVEVMVTFYSGNESVPAADINTSENDTQERDKEGGTRSVKQTDKDSKIVYEEAQGTKKPFIVKELLPKVKGVVIVADGAGSAEVKSNLSMAAAALLEVAAHKIQVFQRNDN